MSPKKLFTTYIQAQQHHNILSRLCCFDKCDPQLATLHYKKSERLDAKKLKCYNLIKKLEKRLLEIL